MPFVAPFKLGPFTVDATGHLSPGEPDAAPAFLFRWRDRVIRARLGHASPTDGRLVLQGTLARVASTADTSDDTVRPRSFALLRWLEKSAPSAWQVKLLADHRVWLETERRIDLPITAAALVTEIVNFLLELAPYLDLLDQTGLHALIAKPADQPPAPH